ncbi:MAG: Hpt domain-containing protein [Alkalispirochaeta sp.]
MTSGSDRHGPDRDCDGDNPPQNLQILNYQGLLDRVGGKTEIAEVVVRNILESLPDHIAFCRETFEGRRISELRQTAHTIKGSAGTAGAEIVAHWAGRINAAIRDETSDASTIGSFLNRLERSVSELLAYLESKEYSEN